MNLGGPEIFLILVVVLLLFGGKRLPELARSLGKSISAFKRGIKEGEDDFKRTLENKDDPGSKPPEKPA